MKIENINNRVAIFAEDGYFLTNGGSLYGTAFVLGSNDSPSNYTELPLAEWPGKSPYVVPQEEDAGENTPLRAAKLRKLKAIEDYDTSDSVNGFYYNGNFMWLDRVTRAVLANTIASAELLGRDTINIWYKDTVCVTLHVHEAKMLLAALEIYATECYNVTASHKAAVNAMTSVSDVENFDHTAGYPQMLDLPEGSEDSE